MADALRIGLDFDNTLVCYDHVFGRAARDRGMLLAPAAGSKLLVRDALRRDGREEDWILLQGEVYGRRMDDAAAFPGALAFLARARSAGREVFIVSHRTLHPARGPAHDLHQAARAWIARHLREGEEPLVAPDRVFLETTREAKIARIASLGCDVFVDDLPEVLLSPAFPERARRILFDPEGSHGEGAPGLERLARWGDLWTLLQP